MIVFLTSSPGGSYKVDGERIPCAFNPANGFVENLKKNWKEDSRILIISSDPEAIGMNEGMKHILEQSFLMTDFSIGSIEICDSRNCDALVPQICEYDVVILAGGHVPTQNAFFHKIHLKEAISDFEGILIGISAGTMNCAETVYAVPELEGEAEDPEYQRFISGLGITELMIMPHYQEMKDTVLDGMRVMEEIVYPDSLGREILCLPDGSYVLMDGESTTLFGEAYLVKDGILKTVLQGNL